MEKLHFTSQAFPNNGMIPSEYTCDGANGNPPLTIRLEKAELIDIYRRI
jgi:phosphatidylethanolamine-binding protein (PEBP) family uncharacterized protein